MINEIKVNKESLSKAHKVNRILSIHRKLTRDWHEFDMLQDEESMETIQKSLDPINGLLDKLVNPADA